MERVGKTGKIKNESNIRYKCIILKISFKPCSISCGGGNQIQTRSCAPLNANFEYWVCEKIDGNFDFEESAVVECAEKLCPTWSQWSSYNSCSKVKASTQYEQTR